MKKLIAVLLVLVLSFCLSMTAFAVEFTPSVEQKDGPTIIEIEDEGGGSGYDGKLTQPGKDDIFVDENTDLKLVITPVSKKNDSSVLKDIRDLLSRAEQEVKKAADVSKLTPEVVGALQDLQNKTSDPLIKELTVKDMVVSDLFDVSLVQDGARKELETDQTLTFCVQTNLRPGDVFFILKNTGAGEWDIIEDYVLDENGALTLNLSELSRIAFVIDCYSGGVDPDGPDSPSTGEKSVNLFLLGAVLFGVAAVSFAGCAVYTGKKRAD